MSVLIAHEIPKQLFPHSRWISDYPYLLAHKLLEGSEHYDEEYSKFYREEVKKHEFSILDNAAYELDGEGIAHEDLYRLGEEYKPTHLILPDVAFNKEETIRQSKLYMEKYATISTPVFIACIQGQGLEDMFSVYDEYLKWKSVDLVAVSCCIVERENKNKLARANYIHRLITRYGIDLPKKLHLLGCKHPNEFLNYKNFSKSIFSLDTSAPIIYGWNGIKFESGGISLDIKKPEEKLADNLDKIIGNEELEIIIHNVRTFRSYINR